LPEFHISILGSGSTGNVTFVSDGSVRVLLDAGLACKEIEKRLRLFGVSPRHLDAVLVSHEHGDHARGAWRFCSKHRIPLYATEGTFRFMPRVPEKPGKEVEWVRVRSGGSFKLGRLTIDLFPTPHDAADPVGFRLRRGKLAFGHVTDIGHVSEEVATGLRGCDAILIESNHDIEMLRSGDYPESLKNRVGSRWGTSRTRLSRGTSRSAFPTPCATCSSPTSPGRTTTRALFSSAAWRRSSGVEGRCRKCISPTPIGRPRCCG